jgi:hypothetical protein
MLILLLLTKPRHTWMEANLTVLWLKSNSQTFLFALALALALPLAHLAMVEIDPALSHPLDLVHARPCTEGEGMGTLPFVAHSVEEHMVGEVLQAVMFTVRAVHVAALALVPLFAEVWTDFLQGGGRLVILVVDTDVCGGRDQGATLCALVVRARDLFRALVPVRARARYLILHIQDTLGVGVVRGQLAGGGEATVAMISGIVGLDLQRLCNFVLYLSNCLHFKKNASRLIINIKVIKTKVHYLSKFVAKNIIYLAIPRSNRSLMNHRQLEKAYLTRIKSNDIRDEFETHAYS